MTDGGLGGEPTSGQKALPKKGVPFLGLIQGERESPFPNRRFLPERVPPMRLSALLVTK